MTVMLSRRLRSVMTEVFKSGEKGGREGERGSAMRQDLAKQGGRGGRQPEAAGGMSILL